MTEVTLANFRCFRERQTARLAPLTLLVGENSTGKTSFMALIRALWDVAVSERVPNFKEAPYDLGTFEEIAHFRGGTGGRVSQFEAGFCVARGADPRSNSDRATHFHVLFRQDGAAPVPSVRRIADERTGTWAQVHHSTDGDISVEFTTPNGRWSLRVAGRRGRLLGVSSVGDVIRQLQLPAVQFVIRRLLQESDTPDFEALGDTLASPTKEDLRRIYSLSLPMRWRFYRPFASAPVRSRPDRTYDPSQAIEDAEGGHVPMFFYRLFHENRTAWRSLKSSLERFGKAAGLFDEITVRTFGGKAGGPFQLQVRQFGKRLKGPPRNIIDVGYGVSQVLPLVTELFLPSRKVRASGPRMLLLQQPEVHLHPSAQAALGTLFCEVAADRHRQLIVETHSDHLIDRVRMDVRDRTTKLRAEDVSLLFFERRDSDVRIHSLRFDDEGNVVGAPAGYRRFFMEETHRSVGLEERDFTPVHQELLDRRDLCPSTRTP